MESGFYKYYNSLPSWAKGAMGIAIVGGIGLIGYAIYNKIKKIEGTKTSNETANAAENEYNKLLKQGQKLSYPDTKYFSAANAIKIALDGCETYVGEEAAVYAVLNAVNKPIDWYYLVNVFGSRTIEGCSFGKDTVYALPELLSDQLGNFSPSSYYTKSNYAYLKDELKKKGVII